MDRIILKKTASNYRTGLKSLILPDRVKKHQVLISSKDLINIPSKAST